MNDKIEVEIYEDNYQGTCLVIKIEESNIPVLLQCLQPGYSACYKTKGTFGKHVGQWIDIQITRR